MKQILFILALSLITDFSFGYPPGALKDYAAEVPTQLIDQEISEYLATEINYQEGFQSDYTLAEYTELKSGQVWYILDGYFTLKDGTILFLDFTYYPDRKLWRAINNYTFVPKENERFLLKADETCNPYKRHFIGVIAFSFKDWGHLDDIVDFFEKELGGSPMIYTDGGTSMVQDRRAEFGAKPLFTLKEEGLISKMMQLPYMNKATIIPSGRNPSDGKISQVYEGVTSACKAKLNPTIF